MTERTGLKFFGDDVRIDSVVYDGVKRYVVCRYNKDGNWTHTGAKYSCFDKAVEEAELLKTFIEREAKNETSQSAQASE